MKSSSIEKIGVLTTQEAILESENLHAWIQDGDKMPSWDGNILYNPNNSDSKKGLLKISIQVKTKTVNNFNPTITSYKYPVSIVDLENYFNNYGVIYFLTVVDKNDKKVRSLFYNCLTPMKINRFLKDSSQQKTKTIQFKKFPTQKEKMDALFLNFYRDTQKQASFTNHFNQIDIHKFDEIKFSSLLLFEAKPTNSQVVESLFGQEVYLYGVDKNYNLEIPLLGPVNLQSISTKTTHNVYIDKKLHFKDIELEQRASSMVFHFSKNITFTIKDNQKGAVQGELSLTRSKLLVEEYQNIQFIEKIKSSKAFFINTTPIYLNNNQINQDTYSKDYVDFIKKCMNLLHLMNVDDYNSIRLDRIGKKHIKTILLLEKALRTKCTVKAPFIVQNRHTIYEYTIDYMPLMFLVKQDKNSKDKVFISDFFESKLVCSTDNKKLISIFSILKENQLTHISYLNFKKVLNSYQTIYLQNNEQVIYANNTFIYLLNAYDKTKRKELLTYAMELNSWIESTKDKQIPEDFKTINSLQLKKRRTTLSNGDRLKLIEITQSDSTSLESKFAAYLLLDNLELAKFTFSKLDLETQEQYLKLPIYVFMK